MRPTDQDVAKYSPSQPRVPKGRPDGGEWVDANGQHGGGNMRGNKDDGQSPSGGVLNTARLVHHAVKNVFDAKTYRYGRGLCARKVRQAINHAGLKVQVPHPRPGKAYAEARDYGPKLEESGFTPVVSTAAGDGYPPPGYTPQPGDVVIIQATSRNKSGHMAVYTGKKGWVSDFIQPDFWPGATYRTESPSYTIYRYPRRTSGNF